MTNRLQGAEVFLEATCTSDCREISPILWKLWLPEPAAHLVFSRMNSMHSLLTCFYMIVFNIILLSVKLKREAINVSE